MKTGYYPGCTLKTKARGLETSALASLKELGVEAVELERWNCCGAVYSLADDDLVHLLAPVRDLIRAHEQGYDRLLTLCSMCYNVLARANLVMRDDAVKRDAINDFLEEESDYRGEVRVLHLLNFLRDEVGFDAVKEAINKPLSGLKVAPYYGCTLTRPMEVSVDPAVTPVVFQDFLTALGAEVVEYSLEDECCGSFQVIGNTEAAATLSAQITRDAAAHGADIMALSCPLCEYNLGRRLSGNAEGEVLPVFYFTQLLALALGLDPEVCRLDLSMPQVRGFLESRGMLAAVA